MKEKQEKYQLGETDSLRAYDSTMMSPECEAALLNLTAILLTICPLIMERGISPYYREGNITILWRGEYHHIMEMGTSPYYGEGNITILWRGEYHHIMERGISPYYGEGNITILWRGEYHHDNTGLFGRKS